MKLFRNLTVLLILTCVILSGCGGQAVPTVPGTTQGIDQVPTQAPTQPENVDWAASIVLDMSSETVKQEVTVKTYVDGDTTHFHVPESVMQTGVLKARYLGVNTPESTGKIEEYGKAASRYTREKLESAEKILIESDNETWNLDATGGRCLVWVWYIPQGQSEYRNLNVELLQNGLAIANASAQNRYGDTCMAAIVQAKAQKVNIYSGQQDPDFYYGQAQELTLKELRCNIESYNGTKVAFSGIVTANSGSQGVYVEEFDPETGLYFGIYVYYGHSLSGPGLEALAVGNEARVVGTVQLYEAAGTWQISGLSYRLMDPKDPGNVQKLSDGHAAAWVPTTGETFSSQVTVGEQTAPYGFFTLDTTLQMENLKVVDAYTTTDEESSSYGAMTLTCECDGITITLRTVPLRNPDGSLISQDAYLGKIITVRGLVSYYDGSYQIKVLSPEHILIQE